MRRHLTLLLLLALTATACGQALGSPRTAATINGDQISVAELEPLVAGGGGVDPATGQPTSETVTTVQVLSNLALITIIEQQISERGGDPVTQNEVDEALQATIEQQGGPEAFQQALDAQGVSRETVRLDQRFQLAVDRLTELLADEVEVSDEAVQAAYDQQFAQPQVSHLLVATEEEAQAAIDRIEAGEDFAAVAQDVSTDPGSAANGGALGPLQPGAFVPEFEEAALALEPGELSEPVQTQFGFHVIRTTAPQPLEDVRGQIEEQVVGQQVQQRLTEVVFDALLSAEASVNPRFGRWAPEISPEGGLQSVIVPSNPLGELVPVPGAADAGLGEVPVEDAAPATGGTPTDAPTEQ
jgi:parvulin-like peptidyl-prolyl isomerase